MDRPRQQDRAGRYRQRIVIEAEPEPQDADSYGDPGDIWSVVAEVWAEVLPTGGRRELVGEQMVVVNNYRVEFRWRTGVTGKMRLSWNGAILNILGVSNPDARRIALVCDCEQWAQ